MAKPITVVKVERDEEGYALVYFSHPVTLPHTDFNLNESGMSWWACTDEDPFEHLQIDELGAYQWGLKIIEKHYERMAKEKADATDAE